MNRHRASRAVTRPRRSRVLPAVHRRRWVARCRPGRREGMTSTDRQPPSGSLPVGHTSAADVAEELLALREENRQLKEGMLARARIDQAMGVLVAFAGTNPDEAWDLLREVSMNTNRKLRKVAEILVGWPAGGTLPDDIREALDAAVAAHCQHATL
ncbi:ANTAR domain-containing protein [Streptomyces mirabilis]